MGPMTDTATQPLVAVIEQRLATALSPTALTVLNESAQHRGHLGDDGTGETHFRVEITAEAFTGQSRIARQRLVNQALADLLATRIHALAIRARAPEEV
jgi:BolA family transcriptional regulator, general stress-responsive regulator